MTVLNFNLNETTVCAMIYMYSVIIGFLDSLNIFIGLSFEILVKIFEHICAFLSSYQVMEKTEIESVRKSIYVTPRH